ncbi:hypothetical protein LguiA_026285 [Lonicera macranthoides]
MAEAIHAPPKYVLYAAKVYKGCIFYIMWPARNLGKGTIKEISWSILLIHEVLKDDINECEDQSLNHCSMGCENNLGGYRCICDPGYELDNNSLYRCRNIPYNSKYKVNVIKGMVIRLTRNLLINA